uniref:hypothetical protein n=1 Tax=Segatella copri TaxID=165179 RepID=UPI003FED6EB6
MKHKVKVTVIDKKIYPELQEKYCADTLKQECVHATMLAMNLSLSVTKRTTISGMED